MGLFKPVGSAVPIAVGFDIIGCDIVDYSLIHACATVKPALRRAATKGFGYSYVTEPLRVGYVHLSKISSVRRDNVQA